MLAVPVIATVGALGFPALAAVASDRTAGVARSAAVHRPSTAGPATVRPATKKNPVEAFFDAGYHYADAVLLSRLWAEKTPYNAKIRAGEKLLNGGTLPTKPGATAWTVPTDVAQDAFFAHGNDWNDALRLAKRWRTAAVAGLVGEVKAAGGRNVLAGLPLETKPRTALPTPEQLTRAFFDAGYHYADAVLLSRLWGAAAATPYDAKLEAGYLLRTHQAVPTRPGATARSVSADLAVQAYFNNGYDYDDAVRLARVWHLGGAYEAKKVAGHKILAGLRLPVSQHH